MVCMTLRWRKAHSNPRSPVPFRDQSDGRQLRRSPPKDCGVAVSNCYAHDRTCLVNWRIGSACDRWSLPLGSGRRWIGLRDRLRKSTTNGEEIANDTDAVRLSSAPLSRRDARASGAARRRRTDRRRWTQPDSDDEAPTGSAGADAETTRGCTDRTLQFNWIDPVTCVPF